MTISANTVLRSRNKGKVLSTLLLRYPRFIHAEVMTHRVFSRNAASSRAIPFEKQVAAMLADPAVPIHFGSNKPGMQAGDSIPEPWRAQAEWLEAMHRAHSAARVLHDLGVHKQIVNRLIEPFTHITVLVSSTEWDNFLDLRDHPDAEPHIQLLAQRVRRCLEDPYQDLKAGEWHLPFVEPRTYTLAQSIKLSVARCASTSYRTVDGFDMSLERAEALHDKLMLAVPQHASPAEHVAYADDCLYNPVTDRQVWAHPEHHGNFIGFGQYRHRREV